MRFVVDENLALRIQLLIIITFWLVEGACEAPWVMKTPGCSGRILGMWPHLTIPQYRILRSGF
jgi:hypothetical protein